MSEVYKDLCDTFDVDDFADKAEETVENTGKEIEVLSNKIDNSQKYKLENQDYLRYELQSLVASNTSVLDILAEQCKVGATPRLFEVYATLSSTIADHLNKLAELEKKITDYRVVEDRENLRKEELEYKKTTRLPASQQIAADGGNVNIQNNTYNFTSVDLLEMVKKAKLDTIETEREEITTMDELPKFDLS